MKFSFIFAPTVFLSLSLFAQNHNSVNFLISDFQVNEKVGYHYAEQEEPNAASDCEGNYTITWLDKRNFYENIYIQQFNAEGKAIGENINITKYGDENYSVSPPSISMDEDGFFVVAWFEEKESSRYICSKRFTKDGIQFGDRIDIVLDDFAREIDVNIDSVGTFLISWMNWKSSENAETMKSIEAQRYFYDGEVIGDRIIIAEGNEVTRYYLNSISVNLNQGFIATWTDSDSKLFFQRFTNSGIKIGNMVSVVDSSIMAVNANPWNAEIAINDSGECIIVWEDFRLPLNQSIYAQKYSSDGERLGSNFKINTNINDAMCNNPDVAATINGEFVITWRYSDGFLTDKVYYQRISNKGLGINGNINIYQLNDSTEHHPPSIASDCYGRFNVTWNLSTIRNGNYNSDIYCKMFDENGDERSNSFLVNDDGGIPTSRQCDSDVAVSTAGDFIITWVDERNRDANIYAQKISKSGDFLGQNYKVNSNMNYDVLDPKLAINDNGISLIVWGTYNPPDFGIMGQLFSNEGNPIGNNIPIVKNVNEIFHTYEILADATGNFIIVWKDKPDSQVDYVKLFSRRISETGEFISDISKIDSSSENIHEWDMVITRVSHNYIVTWHGWSGDSVNASIYSQIYSSDGEKVGERILIQENDKDSYSIDPVLVVNVDGSFCVGWTKVENLISKYVVQKLSYDGNKIGTLKTIPNIYDSTEYWNGSELLSNNKGDYFITSYSDELNYVARRFDADFSQIGDKLQVVNSNNSSPNDFRTVLIDNKLYSTWTNTTHHWYARDVWVNVIDINNFSTNVELKKNQQIPIVFLLSQNYPNPFNPSTLISYSIPSSSVMPNSFQHLNDEVPDQVRNDMNIVTLSGDEESLVTLKIFDILGREISTLVNEKQKSGNYEVIWDARNQPSGVYFYKIQAGDFVKTKKMVLLR